MIIKRIGIISAFLLFVLCSAGQVVDISDITFDDDNATEDVDNALQLDTISDYDDYTVVDYFCYPDYEGGKDSIMAYIQRNLYIPQGYEEWSGTVLVEVLIEPDGTLSKARVRVPLNPVLDAEAVRVVMSLPNKWIWDPSRCYLGRTGCFYNFPVKF